MRGKIRRLEEALDCSFFTGEHAAVLAMMLAAIDGCTAQIEALTARIEELIEPYLPQVEQLDEVHGIGTICAQDVIAEIGVDMTLFATGNSMLTIVHALLSDPDARYTDLGADYYEQRMHARRQARNHVRSLERLGYKVTVQAITPETGELLPAAS